MVNMEPKSAVFLHSTEKHWNLQIVKRNHASMSGSLRFVVKADSVTNDRISSSPLRDLSIKESIKKILDQLLYILVKRLHATFRSERRFKIVPHTTLWHTAKRKMWLVATRGPPPLSTPLSPRVGWVGKVFESRTQSLRTKTLRWNRYVTRQVCGTVKVCMVNMEPKSAVFLHSTEKHWNLQIVKRNHASMSGSLRFVVKADSVTNDRISSSPLRDLSIKESIKKILDQLLYILVKRLHATFRSKAPNGVSRLCRTQHFGTPPKERCGL